MKKYSKPLLIVAFVSLTIGLSGQFRYKSGYIITLKNDTIYGKIYDGNASGNSKVCDFKASNEPKAIKYLPGEIKAYKFIGDKYYCSKKIFTDDEYKYVFVEVLLEGKFSLYNFYRSSNMSYYIEKENGDLIGLQNEKVSVRANENQTGFIQIKVNIYKDTLFNLFKDSKAIRNQLENVGYNKKALINITKAYLDETCKGSNCITYEKKLSTFKPTFGIFSGVQFSQINFIESVQTVGDIPILVSDNVSSAMIVTYPVGIFYNTPVPFISDRISVQIEAIGRILNYNEEFKNSTIFSNYIDITSTSLSFPLLIKYEIPFNKLTPSVAIGKETGFVLKSNVTVDTNDKLFLHSTQKGGWFFELGANYKISPKLSLFSNIRVQSNSNLIIAEQDKNTSYSNALQYKLFNKRYSTNAAMLFLGIRF